MVGTRKGKKARGAPRQMDADPVPTPHHSDDEGDAATRSVDSQNDGLVGGGGRQGIADVSGGLVRARRQQKSQREVVDEALEELQHALIADTSSVETCMQYLDMQYVDLEAKDEELRMLLLNENVPDEEYDAEVKAMKFYQKRVMTIIFKARKVVQVDVDKDSHISNGSQSRTHHRFPKLELPMFGGDPKEWLSFWSQFEIIDKDESMTNTLKFQYLIRCMIDKSPAQKIVSVYTISEINYNLAVQNLKDRFGREDMLVQVYVRDLISMMLENARNKNGDFSSQFVMLSTQLQALGSLGVTTDKCAAILYPMVESSLLEDVLLAWERYRSQLDTDHQITSEDLLDKLMIFLKREVEGKERIRMARDGFTTSHEERNQKIKKKEIPTAASLISSRKNPDRSRSMDSCVFCGKSSHPSESCYAAAQMTMEVKQKAIKENNRCFKCFRTGHRSNQCQKSVKCTLCNQSGHYAVMCRSQGSESGSGKKETTAMPSFTMGNEVKSPDVLLMTMVVRIHGKKCVKDVRALVDTGSQKSYILEDTVRKVGLLELGQEKIVHQLFGGTSTPEQSYSLVKLKLSNPEETFLCDFNANTIGRISSMIKGIPNGPWMKELAQKGVNITDYGLDNQRIEILIGNDVAGKLFTGRKYDLLSGPTAIETRLGWVMSGKMLCVQPTFWSPVTECTSQVNVSTVLHTLDQVKNLWELDVIGITDPVTVQTQSEVDNATLGYFESTVTVNNEGRYEVHLPWVKGHAALPSNRSVAEKRLLSATQKVKKDGTFEAYGAVFDGWLQEGIIEVVPKDEENNYGHFLPHRPVYKWESLTTPIRPVFDASAKTRGNPSLNDCLEKGPNFLEQIPDILTRFRWNNVGITSDIKKAFLQMSVVKEHRDFMRFLWWENKNCQNLKQFRHCRVVFGISSSPFLLAATLMHHLFSWKDRSPDVVDTLSKSLYVDNCLTSVSSFEEALKFQEEAQKIMMDGKFDLRGWEFGPSDSEKIEPVLGIKWNLRLDTLFCDLRVPELPEQEGVTKRKILGEVNKIYDPIGILCGFTIIPKILLQSSWKLKVGWDDALPKDISDKFLKWRNQIEEVTSVQIPRKITQNGGIGENISLHIFSDASGTAYATCVFLRSELDGKTTVQLVMARSRVAPLKSTTIPRLELLGCLIGARLGRTVMDSLKLDCPVHCWTDSSTALSWIQRDGNWGVFVANRVNEIRKLMDGATWHHVPGEMNPADLPSRGCTLKILVERRWWEGPGWLYDQQDSWPKSSFSVDENEINEERKKTVVSSLVYDDEDFLKRMLKFSDYNKILRIMAYVVRFLEKSRKQNVFPDIEFVRKSGIPDMDETVAAELTLLKIVQRSTFGGADDSRLKQLRAFEDMHGVLRVKTRLTMGAFDRNFKYPIVLPGNNEMTRRIIWNFHVRNCHAGVQVTQAQLREFYWILDSRRTISKELRKSVRCLRIKSRPIQVEEPPLPLSRIQVSRPFDVTGVDLFGPLYIRGKGKAWVVLFTCANFRAIHLELTTSMSTEGFLKCFRRFVSRRGRPTLIYSDNGRNFVGAANLMNKVDWEHVEQFATVKKIKWIFNPPAAPWWGGWWERLIGIVKNMLRAVLDHARVNLEEMATLLCDVEGMVNDRPLTYVSENVDDLQPLTPSTFLRSGSCILPEVDYVDAKMMRTQYKHVQNLRDELNSRFRKEYLGQLKHMGKMRNSKEVKVGDVVLVQDDLKKKMDWPIGVIEEVFPGRDGKIRTVKVRTKDGRYVRAVQRIFPLELNETEPFGGNTAIN